jgi:hypothetical protein
MALPRASSPCPTPTPTTSWHGYVQTYYDTTSHATIYGLIDELKQAPPKWILYQRNLVDMEGHKNLYNGGKPLPHQYLDELIQHKIASGEWQPVYTSNYGTLPLYADSWTLIRTHP